MWGRPDILWGLLALAIPIVLHLLQLRRYRRVAFSNVSFLKDVQKETQSRHRLRNLLILLSRLLAFAAIILAFADPMLAPDNGDTRSSRQAVSIYIDTSPSMMASGETGPLVQEAKQKATALVEAFSETDKFHIFTSEFDGQDQRYLTQTEALERIAGVQQSSHAPNLDAVVLRSSDQFMRAEGATPRAFWISDLQKSSHDMLSMAPPDSAVAWHVLPVLANEVPNVWIDSVWFDAPLALADRPAAIHIRIQHDATEGADGLPLTLKVDGTTEALGSFNLVPGLPTDTVLRFSHGAPGPHHLEVSIQDAPVRFDDSHHIGYDVQSGIEVFHWTDANAPFRKASQSVERAFESATPLSRLERGSSLPSAPMLSGYDLVVMDGLSQPSSGALGLLEEFVRGGGSVLVIPDSAAIGAQAACSALGLGVPKGWLKGEGQVSEVEMDTPALPRSVPEGSLTRGLASVRPHPRPTYGRTGRNVGARRQWHGLLELCPRIGRGGQRFPSRHMPRDRKLHAAQLVRAHPASHRRVVAKQPSKTMPLGPRPVHHLGPPAGYAICGAKPKSRVVHGQGHRPHRDPIFRICA